MTSQMIPPPRGPRARVTVAGGGEPTTLTDLVERARRGDRRAWSALVERFERLVWKATRSVDLSAQDREEASQNTWLRLFEHLGQVRDPERLAGWLSTTARNEALAVASKGRRVNPSPFENDLDLPPEPAVSDDRVIDEELRGALRAAFTQLPERCQKLLGLLMSDLRYEEVASKLDTTVGYIGPTRGRCLDHLRAMAELRPYLTGRDA